MPATLRNVPKLSQFKSHLKTLFAPAFQGEHKHVELAQREIALQKMYALLESSTLFEKNIYKNASEYGC